MHKEKIIVFSVLFVLLVIVSLMGHFDFSMILEQDFLFNVLAEIFGVILTVFLVDYLLGKGKERKIKKLNQNQSKWVRVALDNLAFTLLDSCKLIEQNERLRYLGNNLDYGITFEKFKNAETHDRIFDYLLNKIETLDLVSQEEVEGLSKNIAECGQGISKSLEKIKRYPDPELLQVGEVVSYACGSLSGVNTIKLAYFETVADKMQGEEKEKFEAGIKAVIGLGFVDVAKPNFKKAILEVIRVRELAHANNLEFNLE